MLHKIQSLLKKSLKVKDHKGILLNIDHKGKLNKYHKGKFLFDDRRICNFTHICKNTFQEELRNFSAVCQNVPYFGSTLKNRVLGHIF